MTTNATPKRNTKDGRILRSLKIHSEIMANLEASGFTRLEASTLAWFILHRMGRGDTPADVSIEAATFEPVRAIFFIKDRGFLYDFDRGYHYSAEIRWTRDEVKRILGPGTIDDLPAQIDRVLAAAKRPKNPAGVYVYNVEIYTRHPKTGERGWSIHFVDVFASDHLEAVRILESGIYPNFDEIITFPTHYDGGSLTDKTDLETWDAGLLVRRRWDTGGALRDLDGLRVKAWVRLHDWDGPLAVKGRIGRAVEGPGSTKPFGIYFRGGNDWTDNVVRIDKIETAPGRWVNPWEVQ